MNKFEFVVLSGARAKQLLRGCTPKVEGPEKPARLAMKEVKQRKIEKIVTEPERV
ncbi:MAG: DNA-directed RNA polymerase subunit omega [Vicinamibacterales bacterium]